MAVSTFALLFMLILASAECRSRYNSPYSIDDSSTTTELSPTSEAVCKFSDAAFELICRQSNNKKWYFVDSMPSISSMTKVTIENVSSNSTDYNIFNVERELFMRTTSLHSLVIINSDLPNVHQLNLRKCPLLTSFNASHNSIASLRGFTFWGTKLTELDLSFNQIARIDNDAFNVKSFGVDGVPMLTANGDDLQSNDDDSGESKTLTGLDLTALYLDNNRLTVVKPEWFANLHKLTILTLNNNLIRSFDAHIVLANNKLLSHLGIDNNLLSSIDNLSVDDLPELAEIDVSSNAELGKSGAKVSINLSIVRMDNISIAECHINVKTRQIYAEHNSISALIVPPSHENELVELHLAHNKLSSLKNITFLSHLRQLDLAYNLIETIENNAFAGLFELTFVNLEHNRIGQVAPKSFNGLTALQTVNLSSNKLIQFVVEFGQTDLRDLDVSTNALTSMNTNIKRRATQLKRINIANNAWECSHLSDTLLFLLMDDIDVFSPDTVSMRWESNVRGIGCNKTTTSVEQSDVIDSNEASKLRQEIETMLDEKINNFEKKITDLIVKMHSKTKRSQE